MLCDKLDDASYEAFSKFIWAEGRVRLGRKRSAHGAGSVWVEVGAVKYFCLGRHFKTGIGQCKLVLALYRLMKLGLRGFGFLVSRSDFVNT